METFTDSQLIVLAKKGDNLALETLIARYLRLVYGFAYSYMKNNADAEDITQEVFVKVWKNLSKFDIQKEFRPWLYRIAKNACLDLLKKRKTLAFSSLETENSGEWLAQGLVDPAPRPDILADRNLLGEKMNQTLDRLSPKYAEVLSLYYKQNLNFREIAENSNISINTVKSRYRRALTALRDIWE